MELISAGTLEKILAEHKRKTEELLPALIKRLINSSGAVKIYAQNCLQAPAE